MPKILGTGARAASICSLIAAAAIASAGPLAGDKHVSAPAKAADLKRQAAESEAFQDSVADKMPEIEGAQADAARVKSSFLYKDEQVESSNWFAKSVQGLADWLQHLFQHKDTPQNKAGEMPSLLGPWVKWVIWTILGALLIGFLAFAIKNFKWSLSLKRRAKAILDEDEPERSLDEWLERAAMLEAQGQYREAVRCLYLACLLKFDEARIARFDRGQTNWEHLARIDASPAKPYGLDFRPPTIAFDHVWYGMRVRGIQDVEEFRAWYREVSDGVQVKAA